MDDHDLSSPERATIALVKASLLVVGLVALGYAFYKAWAL